MILATLILATEIVSVTPAGLITFNDGLCTLGRDGGFKRAERAEKLTCDEWYAVTHRCSPGAKPTARPTATPEPTPTPSGSLTTTQVIDCTRHPEYCATTGTSMNVSMALTDGWSVAYDQCADWWGELCWRLDECGKKEKR